MRLWNDSEFVTAHIEDATDVKLLEAKFEVVEI